MMKIIFLYLIKELIHQLYIQILLLDFQMDRVFDFDERYEFLPKNYMQDDQCDQKV